MAAATDQRFILQPYKGIRSRHTCHQCRQKHQLALYIDTETGEPLADHVGRCNRENECGYHYTPKQHFAAGGIRPEGSSGAEAWQQPGPPEPEKPVDFLPFALVGASLNSKFYPRNNLYQFLSTLFGEAQAASLFSRYLIGTSGHWKGAHVYWQIDSEGQARQCKIMLCDPVTGKRVKKGAEVHRLDKATRQYIFETAEQPCAIINGKWLNENTKDLNLQQTFFGAHLLTEHPDKPVCVTESEKTALIASVYLPGFIWLATGGASGCKWREYATYKVLKGRSVTFFPDYGYFNRQSGKTYFDEWQERCQRIAEALPGTKIKVSDLLERKLQGREREDQDLADLLLIRDESTGTALTENSYPVIWDNKTAAA